MSFFFNDTATTEIYTLSLHDALPIFYGVSQRREFIQGLPGAAGEPVRVRALATLYDRRTAFAREILKDLNGYFGEALFGTVIHANVKLKEASSYGVPIVGYDPLARGSRDYMSLAEEVLAGC